MEISEEYSKELIRKYAPKVIIPSTIAMMLSAAVYQKHKAMTNQEASLYAVIEAARKRYAYKVECLFEDEAYDDLEDSLDLFF